ncbi:MAG: hypothetical protein HY066_04820 [Betaproteobacteria bacterium]|nr:hypothetical protein [Betaproteobacteria bacterium]
MNAELLRERVYSLSERFSWLGIGPDIPAMSLCELEGVYRFLLRIADE